jgi:hypothetical protein
MPPSKAGFLQLAYANDWVAVTFDDAELLKSWEVWRHWLYAIGAKLGVNQPFEENGQMQYGHLKTVVTGIRRLPDGRYGQIRDPKLRLPDGAQVPCIGYQVVYKHLGVLRCADGSDTEAWKKLKRSLLAAIRRVAQMQRPTMNDMILCTNGLFMGIGGYTMSSIYIPEGELMKIERAWRKVFNFKIGWETSSPCRQLYDHSGGGNLRNERWHLVAIGGAALYAAFCRAMADKAPTPQRCAARAALGLAFRRWGCCEDPATWDCAHLSQAMHESLQRNEVRHIADAFILFSLQAQEAEVQAANESACGKGTRAIERSGMPGRTQRLGLGVVRDLEAEIGERRRHAGGPRGLDGDDEQLARLRRPHRRAQQPRLQV